MKPHLLINRRFRRIMDWSIFYILLIAIFALVIYWQAKDVNTLGFAKGTIDLTTTKSKYTVGESVAYTLTNKLQETLTLPSACPLEPLAVYKWDNSKWTRIHATTDANTCVTMPAQTNLAAGASITQSFDSWKSLFAETGIYRIVALATNYTSLPYADFQVVAPVTTTQVQTPAPQIIYQNVYTPVYIPVPSGSTGGTGRGGDD